MPSMEMKKANGLLFGTSICYTSANYKAVTSDEFMDMLISHGVRFNWYFHYMPIGDGANVDLMLNAEQREYMIHRVREIRGYTGGKPIFCIDFQNDGEFVGGCIAGGRNYFHINANGDAASDKLAVVLEIHSENSLAACHISDLTDTVLDVKPLLRVW